MPPTTFNPFTGRDVTYRAVPQSTRIYPCHCPQQGGEEPAHPSDGSCPTPAPRLELPAPGTHLVSHISSNSALAGEYFTACGDHVEAWEAAPLKGSDMRERLAGGFYNGCDTCRSLTQAAFLSYLERVAQGTRMVIPKPWLEYKTPKPRISSCQFWCPRCHYGYLGGAYGSTPCPQCGGETDTRIKDLPGEYGLKMAKYGNTRFLVDK